MTGHPIIDTNYSKGTAYAPHALTDRFFQLANGSHSLEGVLADTIRLIKRVQLMDQKLWRLFVNQFRQGNTDDHNRGWRCEYWGKMMRGACMVYQCAPDEELYAVITETVRDMLTTQDEYGRFSTYSKEKELDGWDLWGRKYILLGMQHFLEICREKTLANQVLNALMKHLDAILDTVGPSENGKKEILEASCHWNGLNSASLLEPVMRMYNLTGEERYLDFAHYIVSRGGTTTANLFEMAYEGLIAPYQFPVTKAYEMISTFEGLLEYHRVTGIEKWRTACINLGDMIARTDITVIGCAGCTHELFDHSAVRQFDAEEKGIMQETCVTVTWMKYCWQLLCLTGESRWADYMEQSFFNALLGSVNTEEVSLNNGLPFDSYSPLLSGVRGRMTGGYQVMEDGACYGCCACIGAAGLGLAGIAEAVCSRDGLYLQFYQRGIIRTLTPAGNSVKLKIDTKYPAEGTIRIEVETSKAEEWVLGLRIPQWSKRTSVWLDGVEQTCIPGQYLKLRQTWHGGCVVEMQLDMRVRLIRPEDYGVSGKEAPYAALGYGPLILARDERLGQPVDRPVSIAQNEDGSVRISKSGKAPFTSLLYFDVSQTEGAPFPVVEYAAAGKTWTEASRMCAWIPVKE